LLKETLSFYFKYIQEKCQNKDYYILLFIIKNQTVRSLRVFKNIKNYYECLSLVLCDNILFCFFQIGVLKKSKIAYFISKKSFLDMNNQKSYKPLIDKLILKLHDNRDK
jgi:hypothetical protein